MLSILPGASFLFALAAAFAPSFQGGDTETIPFTHEKHVSPYWSSADARDVQKLPQRLGEQARDCRGCHDYRAGVEPAQLLPPTAHCNRCHDPKGIFAEQGVQSIDASKARVDPAEEEQRFFKHAQHLVHQDTGALIDCADCHYQDSGTAARPQWQIKIPADNLEGKAYCVKCHETSSAEVRAIFNAGLTREAKAQSAAGAVPVFSHAAHLAPEELARGEPDACKRCHTALEAARPDALAETQFDTAACADCHVGMQFAASTRDAQGVPSRKASPSRGTFSHAQHLGARRPGSGVSARAADTLTREGCLACHAFETAATDATGVRTFRLAPKFRGTDGASVFQGCVQCHTEVDVQGHGNVDACAHCHSIQPGSLTSEPAFAGNRPRDALARVDPASFTFERQSHKFIAKGREQDAPESCAKCHKAKIAEQDSRIRARVFSHATHLPMARLSGGAPLSGGGAPADAVCTECHASVAGSTGLAGLAANHDLSACVDCHGDRPPSALAEAAPRTQAFRFDHSRHVGKRDASGRVQGCADCHVTDGADRDSRVVLAGKIAECTLCHRHEDVADERINRHAKATVAACARCHAAGVPARGAEVEVARARLVFEGGFQRHEGTARCSTCHRLPERAFDDNSRQRTKPEPLAVVAHVDHDKARTDRGRLASAHFGQALRRKQAGAAPGAPAIPTYFSDETSCVACHWHNPTLCTDNSVDAGIRESTLPAVRALLTRPDWRTKSRAEHGKDLGGPGTTNPGGYPGLGPALPGR